MLVGMGRQTRAESRERTRASLRAAAAELVAAQGLQRTSIEQITDRAGFSRGAFYANYRTKEELFAELLQERVYAIYRALAKEWRESGETPTPRQTGERLAAMIGSPDGKWLFALWLELLAHAARHPEFRGIAAEFWRGTRELAARGIQDEYAAHGEEPPIPPSWIASASIALDLGLAIQHSVDPDEVPLDVYPAVFDLLMSPLHPRHRAPRT
jgi:AcrR family transcriptional regulator